MLAAYAGGVDVYGGETLEDAHEEIRRTFDGGYGTFQPALSTLVVHDDRITAATLVTIVRERPFVAFTMTHPDWKRRGLGRATLCHSIDRILQAGWQTLDLVVTRANAPALRLYEQLGFREIEENHDPTRVGEVPP